MIWIFKFPICLKVASCNVEVKFGWLAGWRSRYTDCNKVNVRRTLDVFHFMLNELKHNYQCYYYSWFNHVEFYEVFASQIYIFVNREILKWCERLLPKYYSIPFICALLWTNKYVQHKCKQVDLFIIYDFYYLKYSFKTLCISHLCWVHG